MSKMIWWLDAKQRMVIWHEVLVNRLELSTRLYVFVEKWGGYPDRIVPATDEGATYRESDPLTTIDRYFIEHCFGIEINDGELAEVEGLPGIVTGRRRPSVDPLKRPDLDRLVDAVQEMLQLAAQTYIKVTDRDSMESRHLDLGSILMEMEACLTGLGIKGLKEATINTRKSLEAHARLVRAVEAVVQVYKSDKHAVRVIHRGEVPMILDMQLSQHLECLFIEFEACLADLAALGAYQASAEKEGGTGGGTGTAEAGRQEEASRPAQTNIVCPVCRSNKTRLDMFDLFRCTNCGHVDKNYSLATQSEPEEKPATRSLGNQDSTGFSPCKKCGGERVRSRLKLVPILVCTACGETETLRKVGREPEPAEYSGKFVCPECKGTKGLVNWNAHKHLWYVACDSIWCDHEEVMNPQPAPASSSHLGGDEAPTITSPGSGTPAESSPCRVCGSKLALTTTVLPGHPSAQSLFCEKCFHWRIYPDVEPDKTYSGPIPGWTTFPTRATEPTDPRKDERFGRLARAAETFLKMLRSYYVDISIKEHRDWATGEHARAIAIRDEFIEAVKELGIDTEPVQPPDSCRPASAVERIESLMGRLREERAPQPEPVPATPLSDEDRAILAAVRRDEFKHWLGDYFAAVERDRRQWGPSKDRKNPRERRFVEVREIILTAIAPLVEALMGPIKETSPARLYLKASDMAPEPSYEVRPEAESLGGQEGESEGEEKLPEGTVALLNVPAHSLEGVYMKDNTFIGSQGDAIKTVPQVTVAGSGNVIGAAVSLGDKTLKPAWNCLRCGGPLTPSETDNTKVVCINCCKIVEARGDGNGNVWREGDPWPPDNKVSNVRPLVIDPWSEWEGRSLGLLLYICRKTWPFCTTDSSVDGKFLVINTNLINSSGESITLWTPFKDVARLEETLVRSV